MVLFVRVCRRGVKRAVTAAIIVSFLLGCLFAVHRLMEVDASLEEEAGRKILKRIQKERRLPMNRQTELGGSHEEKALVQIVPSRNKSIGIQNDSRNKQRAFLKRQSNDLIPLIHGGKTLNETKNGRRDSNLHLEIQKSKESIEGALDVRWPAPNFKLHAFYYPWYGNPDFDERYFHWNHEILPHWNKREGKKWPSGQLQPPGDIGSNFYPDLGCYSSRDPAAIEDHMKQLRLAGIGVLSMSWYPSGRSDEQGQPNDSFIPLYLDAAEKFGLKVTFHSEPYKGRSEQTFLNDIQYIIDQYGHHPAFYRYEFKGRQLPMYYIYDSYLTNGSKWARVFGEHGDLSVRDTKYDGIFLGLYVETRHRNDILEGKFDGFYTYFASNGFTYGSRWQNWKNLAEFARLRGLLYVPSVGPGYVDTRVRPWNSVNTRKREHGTYYDRAFQAALKVKPKIISVTSFNEWHEGTQIERAVPKKHKNYTYEDYGREGPDKYLLLTQKWSEAFKD